MPSPRLSESLNQESRNDTAEMLALVGHDIRTPLAALRNALQMMKMATTDASRSEWALSLADRQVDAVTDIVDRIASISSAGQRRSLQGDDRIDLAALAQAAIVRCAGRLGARQQSVALVVPVPPIQIEGNRANLESAIAECIYAVADLSAARTSIEMAASLYDNICKLTLVATAPPHGAFATAGVDEARSEAQGTNLGKSLALLLAREIVRVQGGELHVSLSGTTVELTVSLAQVVILSDR